ncbi:MAG: hypothetical protein ACRDPY_43450 [Streptosporangiaceae bacterium]
MARSSPARLTVVRRGRSGRGGGDTVARLGLGADPGQPREELRVGLACLPARPGRRGSVAGRQPELPRSGLAALLEPRIHRFSARAELGQLASLDHEQDHLGGLGRDQPHGGGRGLDGTVYVGAALDPCLPDQEQAVGEHGTRHLGHPGASHNPGITSGTDI